MTERCTQGFSRRKKRNLSFSWKYFYSQILRVSNAAEACGLEMDHLAIMCLRLCSSWSVRGSSTQDTGLFILKLVCLGTEIITAKSRLTFQPNRTEAMVEDCWCPRNFMSLLKSLLSSLTSKWLMSRSGGLETAQWQSVPDVAPCFSWVSWERRA